MSEIEILKKLRQYHFDSIDYSIDEIASIGREIEVLESIELEHDLIRAGEIARGEGAPNG
jgi:hypothetical protein